MQLTLPQSEIFVCPSRFVSVVAGRRFGKTFLSTGKILEQAVKAHNRNVWYVAPTYGAAKEIAWDMLLQTIPMEYIAKTNESSLSLKLINNSTISLKGAEKPNNLRGRALDFVVLDEFADMRPEAWYEVLRPSLSDRQGGAMFIGTPKGRNHFYDVWTKGADGDPDWQSFQYTTLEGGNVPETEIAQAMSDLDERTFNQEYNAKFVNYSGIIYYGFNREESIERVNSIDDTIHIGMDFNLDPMSAVVCLRHGQQLLAIDEIVIWGSNTDEMVQEIKKRYPHKRVIIYPDPASRQNRTSAGGRTDLSILQNAGFEVHAKPRHALVRDRINAVNSRLLSVNGKRNLLIDPKCKQTIKSLERQTYKEGTSIPNKDGYDHMNDALGYLVEYMFPVRTEYQRQQPQRWS